MLVADPATGDLRRFLVGPKGCEITGWTLTPDGQTLFVNVQHPGENATFGAPAAESNWPDYQGRPRSATVAIRRDDGGVIGA
jgi:secreted PhoX family phosphatase